MCKTTNNRNARFGRNGCYTCHICKKQTRETGLSESSSELCALCFERTACQNSVSDNGPEGDAFGGPTWQAMQQATSVDQVNAIFAAFCERHSI